MAESDLVARVIELEAQVALLERERLEGGEGALLKALMDDIDQRRLIEEELRRANEWLHLAQEAGRVAAYAYDFRTGVLDWSPSAKGLYGVPSDQDVTLEDWLSAVHPDDRESVQGVAQAAIAEGRDVDHRFRIVRGDGRLLWIQDRARVHLGRDGLPDRLVGINVDVTELVTLERRSAENEQRLRLAMKAERVACWDWDLVTNAVTWDESLPALAGVEDFGGDFAAFFDLVHEEDRPVVREALDAAFAGERDYDVTFRMIRSDGTIRRTQTRAIILRDHAGKPLRMVGVDSDITASFAADEQLRLFNGELHYRLKNNLATVQAMVRTTIRNSPDMGTFEKTFTQRLEALAVTYDLLRTGDDSADLSRLVEAEVAPYAGTERRLSVDGPEVVLPAAFAVAIGMIMHELATNSCKYGSLSLPGGQLDVRWAIQAAGKGEHLVIDWTEQGGPTVTPPTGRGFGSKLLERLVSAQLKGSFTRRWDSDGLKLRIVCPLA